MPRFWFGTLRLIAWLLMTIPTLKGFAAGMETLVPDNTKGFVSITNIQDFNAHWEKTQLGKLMEDPAMRPFRKDLRRQFEEQFSRARDKLGLTLDDLRGVPTGEVTTAVVLPSPDESAIVVMMDVKGNHEKAKGLLATVTANQLKKGAKKSEATEEGVNLLIFDLPPDSRDPRPQQAIYFLKGDLLGAADHRGVIRTILARSAGKAVRSLADHVPFVATMKRCAADAPAWSPQVRWFVEPVGYMEARRIAIPPEQRPKGKTTLDLFKNVGFSAVTGVGGFVDFSVEGVEMLHRTAVYAPPPYEKSMKMMVFPNQGEFAPQPWVPRELATYSTFYMDVLNAFDHFGPFFDYQIGGEPGSWADVLEGLKTQVDGPRIDLRAEIVAQLDNRVSLLGDYQLPITTGSERTLIAVLAKDVDRLQAGLAKFYRNDREVRKRKLGEFLLYENPPQEKAVVPQVDVEFPGQKRRPAGGSRGTQEPMFPNATITVAYGHLMIASHYDFMTKVLGKRDARETLARAADYRVVNEGLQKVAPSQSAGRMFSRADEEYRVTYELIRQGKLPQSQTLLARMMNSMSSADSKRPREQRIDGRQMPDYEIVRRHLGPGGTYFVSEKDGWFLRGFMLAKEAP